MSAEVGKVSLIQPHEIKAEVPDYSESDHGLEINRNDVKLEDIPKVIPKHDIHYDVPEVMLENVKDEVEEEGASLTVTFDSPCGVNVSSSNVGHASKEVQEFAKQRQGGHCEQKVKMEKEDASLTVSFESQHHGSVSSSGFLTRSLHELYEREPEVKRQTVKIKEEEEEGISLPVIFESPLTPPHGSVKVSSPRQEDSPADAQDSKHRLPLPDSSAIPGNSSGMREAFDQRLSDSTVRCVDKQTCVNMTPHACAVCGKEFRGASKLMRHMPSHTGEKPYKCDVCKKRFSQEGNLKIHRQKHTGEWSYWCDVCAKGFSFSSDLQKHKLTHSGDSNKCDICGKRFLYQGQLEEHKQTHTGENPYKCDMCGERFGKAGYLKAHKRTHTGEMSYKCDVCGKGFSYTSSLNRHKRTHTGEKPYECSACGKRFTRESSLKEHEEGIHTENRPYKCDVCDKEFRFQGNLRDHKRIHTGEKPYKCDVCNKAFSAFCILQTHTRTHTGEKPFGCDVCGKEFSQAGTLKKHKRTHTGKNKQTKQAPPKKQKITKNKTKT